MFAKEIIHVSSLVIFSHNYLQSDLNLKPGKLPPAGY